MSIPPDDGLKRDLWLQVSRPYVQAHAGHGVDGGGGLSRLWTSDVDWRPEHLDACPVVVRLGMAPETQLLAVVRLFGLMPYARALRETLSGSRLKRVEKALGPTDWARLLRAEAAVDTLACDEGEALPLAHLLDGGGPGKPDGCGDIARLDLLGAQGLAACFAAFGEPWRLRLGLRLPPALHEAVLAARARPRKQAERRLMWAFEMILPTVVSDAMVDDEGSMGESSSDTAASARAASARAASARAASARAASARAANDQVSDDAAASRPPVRGTARPAGEAPR